GVELPVLEAVVRTNAEQPREVLRLLGKRFPSLEGLSVGTLGVAFKAGTDDVRESPAIPIIQLLSDGGAKVKVYDPIARSGAERALHECAPAFSDSMEEAVADVDAVVLVTRWPEFERLPELLAGMDRPPVVIDGR